MKGRAACCRQSAQTKQRGLQRQTEMHQVLISTQQAGVQADGLALGASGLLQGAGRKGKVLASRHEIFRFGNPKPWGKAF